MKAILALALLTVPAHAADANRRSLPPSMCPGASCYIVHAVVPVSLPAPGYRLPDGRFVHRNETRRSPDAQFRACLHPNGAIVCFFVPEHMTR